MLTKTIRRINRHKKIREKLKAGSQGKRLVVFRSNQHIYGMVVDDQKNHTLISVSDKDLKSGTKVEKSRLVGKLLAEKSLKAKITKVIFDRGGYLYHGRVKALAEGARQGGLKF